MKQQVDQNQSVMLADNFPAKAFLLITYLTENDPKVSSFSADGSTFEIYDQSIFCQKYLPQYFKHSNYGSFVRQLNLYGFTSSRLKSNNEVVVWSHDFFCQDRKDLVKDIKRTKKTKSNGGTNPSHVHINLRSPSPPSLTSVDDAASAENSHHLPGKIGAKGGSEGLDHGWLESEFTYLKQQNKFLEQKLDTLLKITLQISSPSSFREEVGIGEKRRRMSPVESSDSINESIHDKQKLFYGNNYGIDSGPHGGTEGIVQLMSNKRGGYFLHEGVRKNSDEGTRKPPPATAEASELEFVSRDESLKRFVDIMLNEEDQEECKAVEDYEQDGNYVADPHTAVAPANEHIREARNITSSPPEPNYDDTLDDELMEEAMNAMAPIDTDGDLFALSEDANEPALRLSNVHSAPLARQPYRTERVTMSNAAVDKSDGPHLIPSTSSGVSAVQSGDIEEGDVPVGVTFIEAHAELVEDDRDGNAGTDRVDLHQYERARQEHERRDRKRIMLLLAFMSVVLIVGVTWPAVVLTKKNTKTYSNRPPFRPSATSSSADGSRCWKNKQGGCKQESTGNWEKRDDDELDDDQVSDLVNKTVELEEGSVDYLTQNGEEELNEGLEDALTQSSAPQMLRSQSIVHHNIWSRSRSQSSTREKSISSLIDDSRGGSPKITSFSVILEGADFVCSRGGN